MRERRAGILELGTRQKSRPELIVPEGVKPALRYNYWNLADNTPAYLKEFTDAKPPVRTYIPEMDAALGGGLRPGAHFIGGSTGAGKTALALYIAERVASCKKPESEQHYGVTIISLELRGCEVRARLGSRLSLARDELQTWKWPDFERLGDEAALGLDNSTYSPEKDRVYMADCKLMELCPRMRIVDGVAVHDANGLLYITEEIAATGRQSGDLVVLDYLQCIDAGEGLDELSMLRDAVRSINLAALRARVPVLVISAVNREASKAAFAKGKNPGPGVFRGSSWIEYTAQSAWALVREPDAERTENYVLERLWPVKNRYGNGSKPIELAYDGAHGQFHTAGTAAQSSSKDYMEVLSLIQGESLG